MIPELSNLESEDYWVRKIQTIGSEGDFVFDLHITSNLEGEDVDCRYELSASGVLNYCLSSKQDGDLFKLDRDHPLIRAYCEPLSELFCQVASGNSSLVLPALLRSHRQYAGDYLAPFDYINPCIVNGWSYGKLATAPCSLIGAYENAVLNIATKCNVLEVGPQKDWDGSEFQERTADIMGFCFGSSYVLCKNFTLIKKTLSD